MPTGNYIAVGVFVNNTKLPEYQIKDKIVTEVDLHGPTSYVIEEEHQRYPVLPFTIDIVPLCTEVVWITVLLDGQVISSRPLKNRFKCDGVKVGDEIHELLFSLPRIAEDQEKPNPLGEYAGTLKVQVKQAVCTGEKQLPVFKSLGPQSTQSQGKLLQHLTKKDVQRTLSSNTGAIVSREGRQTQTVIKTSSHRRAVGYSQTGTVLEEVVLHYRPRIYSNVPAPAVTEASRKQSEEEHQRMPLGDVGNFPSKRSADGNLPGTNMIMTSTKETKPVLPVTDIKRRESAVSQTTALLGARVQALLSSDIKRRESCAVGFTAVAESSTQGLRPACVAAEEMGHAVGLLTKEKIKHRDSFAAMGVPSEGLIPADKIKRRESCLPQIPSDELEQKNFDIASQKNSFIVIDDTEDEDDDKPDNDSVIYMGDDDCYVMDLSCNVSLIELDDTVDSMDYLQLDPDDQLDL